MDATNSKVAILVYNYFEEPEFTEPKAALEQAGAEVHVISPIDGQLQAMSGDTDKAGTYMRDIALDDADIDAYDALIIPGGTVNADQLRMQGKAQEWVQRYLDEGKLVAAICHGPWLLVSADVVRGRTLTSFPSLQDDIKNAGGSWVDQEVSVDQTLITSRTPDDLEAFNKAVLQMLSKVTD